MDLGLVLNAVEREERVLRHTARFSIAPIFASERSNRGNLRIV